MFTLQARLLGAGNDNRQAVDGLFSRRISVDGGPWISLWLRVLKASDF